MGVVILDADSLVVLWSNDAYREFLEEPYRSNGVVGARIDDFLPSAAAIGLSAIFREVAETGIPFESQEYVVEGLGRGITYWRGRLLRADGIYGGNGQQLLLLVTDVTNEVEKRAEEQSRFDRVSEEHLFTARVLEKVPVPITYVDRDLIYRQCNEEAAKALGFERAQILDRSLADIVGSDGEVFARVKSVIETGEPFIAELDFAPPGGPPKHYAVAYLPDFVDGVVVGAVTTGFDITDVIESKKRVEKQRKRLAESEARYRAIGELIPYGIWICDPDGRALYHSPSYQEMTGRSNDELREFGWADLLASDEIRARTLRDWEETVRHKNFWDYKHTLRSKDGSWRTVLSRGVPLRDESGTITSWVGINLDITEQERYASFRAALASIMTSIVGNLDVRDLLSSVAKEAVAAVGADIAMLFARDARGWELQLIEGDFDERSNRTQYLTDHPLLSSRAVESGSPQIVEDMRSEFGDDPLYAGLESGIFVPLFLEGAAVGVLSLIYTSSRAYVDAALSEFVENLGKAVSVAMRAASVHEHQRHVAEILQESLLTVPDHLKELSFAHLYESAARDERIGGDFYDAFLFETKVFFAIGDVSGKGLEAATLTSLTKNALRAHMLDTGSPAEALTKVNGVVETFSESHEFVTVFAGIFDSRTGILTYASAGHPAPMVVSGRSVRPLVGAGPLLGAFPNARYSDMTSRLQQDETLLLYTDGIIEAKNADNELFGEALLIELLRESDEADVQGLIYEVFDTVRRWASGVLSDDVAMLGLRPAPSAYDA